MSSEYTPYKKPFRLDEDEIILYCWRSSDGHRFQMSIARTRELYYTWFHSEIEYLCGDDGDYYWCVWRPDGSTVKIYDVDNGLLDYLRDWFWLDGEHFPPPGLLIPRRCLVNVGK